MRLLLLKTHVDAYTRKDGTPVKAHERDALSAHPLRHLIDAADDNLAGHGAAAINGFIGHEPRAMEHGATVGFMSARPLEDAYSADPSAKGLEARNDIERTFKPVREALRGHYGDRVRLYRVQGKVVRDPNAINMSSTESGDRAVLSWTSDKAFADFYAGVRPDMELFTEKHIADAERVLAETGMVQITKGRSLRREAIPVRTADGKLIHVDCLMIYNGDESLTDTESVRAYMEGENEYRAEHNAKQAANRAQIVVADVPLDDVVWVSNRANQSEFIVRNHGDHAILAKALFLRLRDPGEPSEAKVKAGNYKKRRIPWMGMTLAIENEVGSIRRGTKPDGEPWATRMLSAYGYVCKSEGVDGDEVDVFLGPLIDSAPMVYVVHQRKVGDWKAYDEDKCMIGFMSKDEAVAAFLASYDDKRFLGPVTAMPVGEFVEKVKATYTAPAMIKSLPVIIRK